MNEEHSSKMLYTMGEVSEMFDVKPSLLRFWEKNFPILKPQKNKKGNRLFTPKDIENLKVIYHLVKERGMTLEGAKRQLKQSRKEVDRDSAIMERLEMIRSVLLQIKAEFKEAGIVPLSENVMQKTDVSEKDVLVKKSEAKVDTVSEDIEQNSTLFDFLDELPAPAPEITLESHNPDLIAEFDKIQTEKIKKRIVTVDLPSSTKSLFDQSAEDSKESQQTEILQPSLF